MDNFLKLKYKSSTHYKLSRHPPNWTIALNNHLYLLYQQTNLNVQLQQTLFFATLENEFISHYSDMVRLCVQYTKWWGPSPDPVYAGALVHRVALFIQILQITATQTRIKLKYLLEFYLTSHIAHFLL